MTVERILQKTTPSLPLKWRLAALLHDAPEYVIGDMITPFKGVLGPGYKALEARLQAAIHLRFGLPAKIPQTVKKQIKRADKLSAWLEATQIAGFNEQEADKYFGKWTSDIAKETVINPRAPMDVRASYIARYEELITQL